MRPGGSLSAVFGPLLGTEPGSGMGLLMLMGGVLVAIAGIAGYLNYNVRNIETILPDHDEAAPAITTNES